MAQTVLGSDRKAGRRPKPASGDPAPRDSAAVRLDTGAHRSSRNWLRYLPLALIVACLAAGYALGWQRYLALDYLAASRLVLKGLVAANPVPAALAFMGIYVLVVALSVPAASILTIFGGFLFGWLAGGMLVAVGATAGATILFLAARSACGDFLRDRVGGRVLRLAEGFEKDAFGYLLALRLAPVFPFFVVNIAPAFFHVSLKTYLAATFLGILPGTFAYAYLGRSIDTVLTEAHKAGRPVNLADFVSPQITIAFLVLALIAVAPVAVRAVKRRRR
ncbi:MAG: TVP38/TMEM64 family protein [Rhizobiaceae bacterium]